MLSLIKDKRVSMMTKKSFFIFFVALGLSSAYFMLDNDQPDPTAQHKARHLADAKDSQLDQQNPPNTLKQKSFTHSPSNKSTNDNQLSMASNDTINTNAIIEILNQLLASNDLNEFSESQAKAVESICQDPKQPLSDLACQALQHRIDLVKQQDDTNNRLEPDWVAVEQNGGGVELEEHTEVTTLSERQQITGESGQLGDDLESSLQTLKDRALLDHSAEVRFKAIQAAIFMKSEALTPLLQEARNDESPANRKLAEEGLQQLRKSAIIEPEEFNNQMAEKALPNLAHTSMADQSAR